MRSQLRLIRLAALSRLRAAGWAPWLLMAGWLLFASSQEPLLLRNYGVFLLQDAAWGGGLVVLLILLVSVRRMPRRSAILANLSILAGVAGMQMLVALLLDRSVGFGDVASSLWGACAFFLAWSPLTITLSRNYRAMRYEMALSLLVVVAALVMGSMMAVGLKSSPDANVLLAVLLACAGATCWATTAQVRCK
jgi:hypothetical protein